MRSKLLALAIFMIACAGFMSAQGAGFRVTPVFPVSANAASFTDTSTNHPTSWSWTFGDGASSRLQNPNHIFAKPGAYTVTLTVGSAKGFSTAQHLVTVVPENSQSGYDMTLTLSDEAQATTIAFGGLAIITGNLNSQSFFPPGKVADYTGFQYLRDTDPDNMGHNTDFLTRVANNMIYILTDDQMAKLATLATSQMNQVNLYAYKRFSLMQAFRYTLVGNIPPGSSGLNLNSVKKASRDLYSIDGQISFDRAMLYARIYKSMTPSQLAYMDGMRGKGFNEWPNITNDQIADKMRRLPPNTATLVMTYASDIFTWYAGSIYSDVYFCPERHGTYYGGFYMKDAPAMGQPGYIIDEGLTHAAGSALINSSLGYVTPQQAALVSGLVNVQRNNLYAADVNIVAIRTQIAMLLRSLMNPNTSTSTVNAQVLSLSGLYGDLDGDNNFHFATVFAQLNATLSGVQQAKLFALRKSILSGTYSNGVPFDFTIATVPYLYSDPIRDPSVLNPYIGNVNYLFFEP